MAASSRCAPGPPTSATARRQLIAFSSAVLLLVAVCGASEDPGEYNLMQLENRHVPWRNLKSTDAHAQNFHSRSGASFGKKSRWGASWETGVTSRRSAASNDGTNATSRLEVEALTAFKAAITSDPLGVLKSWRANSSDVCDWVGVVCSRKHPNVLIALNLGGRQLVGYLNSALQELGRLSSLRRLDLSNNLFNGSISGAALANCSNLSYFNISYNELTGSIPILLGELVHLEVLDFNGNNLTGEIPKTLGNCSSLTVLNLGSNLLTGEIPTVFGRLSRLEFLNLAAKLQFQDTSNPLNTYVGPQSVTSLSGSIPITLGNCSSLKYLDVTYNSQLEGELPFVISLKSLRQLRFSRCNFRGLLPTQLGNLTGLRELRLSYNQFYGDIPDVLGRLRDLGDLWLGGNNLSGVIPISILKNCTRLMVLTLQENALLTGRIPPQLGLLKNLEVLQVWGNSFTGDIPVDIANCSALTRLDISSIPITAAQMGSWIESLVNLVSLDLIEINLQGEIPKGIGRLSRLRYVQLHDNNLTGVIPFSLGNCTSLAVLDISNNELTGAIPPQIGLLMNLVSFVSHRCFLTGSLPASIANLTQIEELEVQSNLLNGTINIDFERLLQLRKFHGEDNHFTGPIPKALSNCSNLFEVGLSRNRLTGEIPASIGNLTRLEQLLLGNNNIIGTVPENILRCSKLGLLDLEFNNLDGNVLVNIGQISSLRVLRLANNHFTGGIPNSLGNLSDMNTLDLSSNFFIGNVPDYVFLKMSDSLISLNLSHNFFSGSLLEPLSQLTNIQVIDISANNISGSIPSNIGNWKALIKLDISTNNLTGVIPSSLGLLPDLTFFNASYNDFQGPVPDSGVFKANVTDASFMGNPKLCGIILGPHRECLASSTTPATSHRSCEGFSCKRVWIPATCGGAGLVFIIVAVVICWVRTLNKVTMSNSTPHLMFNSGPQKRFSETDILRTIAGDGSGDNIVGVGSKGTVVYRGVLSTGEMFALKVFPSSRPDNEDVHSWQRADSELLREARILAKLRHRSIVKVLGVSSTSDVRAIILEYMPQGSLHNHLYLPERGSCELTWQTRLNIAFGVAQGMRYLHHEFPEPLIHRDLKPSNILLDANLDPKVGDFGISRFVSLGRKGQTSVSKVCGTVGYMPPEYAMGPSISTKGDVYAYGIVLLELLTRKSPTSSATEFGFSGNLRGWVMENFQESPIELLDSILQHECISDSLNKHQMLLLMRLAIFCTADLPKSRPSMSDVLAMLTQIKEVQLLPIIPRTIEELATDSTIGISETEGLNLVRFSSF